ncbi:AsmA-like C-terminal region-containing protein [Deltaproteobacteria bacterium]|nr:AsmA-like C-terminal region-containing protein [Deltaproteobacteria bacterium]
MLLKKIRYFIVPVLLLGILFISFLVLGNALVQRPSVQKALIGRLSHAIEYDIQTGEIELNIWRGIGVLVNDFDARSRDGNVSFSASRVRVILDTRELISGRVVPSSLQLFKPKIEIVLKEGLPLSAGSEAFGSKGFPFFRIQGIKSILIEQGQVNFEGRSFHMEEFFLNSRQTSPAPLTLMLKSHGTIGFKEKKIPFELNGIILPPSIEGISPSVDIMVRTGKAPLSWIPLPASLPIKGGDFETRLKIEGNLNEQTRVNGSIGIDSLEFALIWRDRNKSFFIPEITFDFQSLIKDKRIKFQPLKMRIHDLPMDLDLMLDLKAKGRPYLELSAESDFMTLEVFKSLFPSPILPLLLEKEIFPVLDSGDIKMNLLSLKGYTDQIRKLRMPENRSSLALGFECRNFVVSGETIPQPFREVSAKVTFADGDFHVSGLDAFFGGNSLIKAAGFNIKGLLSPVPSFEVLINGSFDIQELMGQKEMKIIPLNASRYLDQFQGLEGRLECKTRIVYEREWESPRLPSGEFIFADCSLNREGLLLPLRLKEAEVRIDENNYSLSGNGFWGNTLFKMNSDFVLTEGRFDILSGDISADMDMNQIISVLYQGNEAPLRFIEPLPLDVSLVKKNGYWSCLGEVDLDRMALESDKFFIEPPGENNNIVFNLEVKSPDRIDVVNVLCRLKDSSIELSGAYNLQDRNFFQVNINSSALTMEDLGIVVKQNEIPARGLLKGNLKISSSVKNVADTSIAGLIEGNDLYFGLSTLSSPISDCYFQMHFSGKQASIKNCYMQVGESPIHISGDLSGWDGLEGDIMVGSDFLDISNILPPEELSAIADQGNDKDGFFHNRDIGINLDISRGIWGKLIFGQMTAELNLKDRGVYIKNSIINMENGLLTLRGHVITGKEPDLLFSGDISLSEQPIDELLESLGIGDNRLKGSLTMEAQLSVGGRGKRDLIPSLAGHANASINQGLIKRSRVFITVLDFLSLQKIYKQRPPEMRDEGFYFESMNADVVIDKGVLSSENFVMRSPVFNAVCYGKMEIPRKTIDFVLGAQPHGTIDNLVSKIPILGYIITGEKRSVLVYPFEVKGTISSPEVKFIPIESLGEGVGGVLKRILLTPIKIFEDLNKATTNNQKDLSLPDQ